MIHDFGPVANTCNFIPKWIWWEMRRMGLTPGNPEANQGAMITARFKRNRIKRKKRLKQQKLSRRRNRR